MANVGNTDFGFLYRLKQGKLNDSTDKDKKTQLDTNKDGNLSDKEIDNFVNDFYCGLDGKSDLSQKDAEEVMKYMDTDIDGDGLLSEEENWFIMQTFNDIFGRVLAQGGLGTATIRREGDYTIQERKDVDGNIVSYTKTNDNGVVVEDCTYEIPGKTDGNYLRTTRTEDGRLIRTIKIGDRNEDAIVDYQQKSLMLMQGNEYLNFTDLDIANLKKPLDLTLLYEYANTKKTDGSLPSKDEIQEKIEELIKAQGGIVSTYNADGTLATVIKRDNNGQELLYLNYKTGEVRIHQGDKVIEFISEDFTGSNVDFTEEELNALYNYANTQLSNSSGTETYFPSNDDIIRMFIGMLHEKLPDNPDNSDNVDNPDKPDEPNEPDKPDDSEITKKTRQFGLYTLEESWKDGKLIASTKTNRDGVVVESFTYHSAGEKYKNYSADYKLENGDLNFSKKIDEKHRQVVFASYIGHSVTVMQGNKYLFIQNDSLQKDGNLLDVDKLYEFANTKKSDGSYPTKDEIDAKITELVGAKSTPEDTEITTRTKTIGIHTLEETLQGKKIIASTKTNKDGVVVEDIKYHTAGDKYKNYTANYKLENGNLNFSKKLDDKYRQVVFASYVGHSVTIMQGNQFIFIQNDKLQKDGKMLDVDILYEFANTKKTDGSYPTKDEINARINELLS